MILIEYGENFKRPVKILGPFLLFRAIPAQYLLICSTDTPKDVTRTLNYFMSIKAVLAFKADLPQSDLRKILTKSFKIEFSKTSFD